MPCLQCDIANLLKSSIPDSDFENLIEQTFINNISTVIFTGYKNGVPIDAAPLKNSKPPIVNVTIGGVETSPTLEGKGWLSGEIAVAVATQPRLNNT
jgi:hypothetical protein